MQPIKAFEFSSRFKRDYKAAPIDVKQAVNLCFANLLTDGRAHRCHPLKGFNPAVFCADVFGNHSWQLTFELLESVAQLKRLARHKEIDRNPR